MFNNPPGGKVWTQRDRYGSEIYLTWERWEHIVTGHPQMEGQLDRVQETLKAGRRQQDPINPHRYHYKRWYKDLPEDYNCVVVVVIVKPIEQERFVVTAYLDYLPRRD
jgi:hypothetical protein